MYSIKGDKGKMNINIRLAKENDYIAVMKIMSQVQDMHVQWRPDMKTEKNMDGIELQVNARNVAAYEMYKKCGFTEKSINLELLD